MNEASYSNKGRGPSGLPLSLTLVSCPSPAPFTPLTLDSGVKSFRGHV